MESTVNAQPWYCESPQKHNTERTPNAIGITIVHENSNLRQSTGSWFVNRHQAIKKSHGSIIACCNLCFESFVFGFMFITSCIMCFGIIIIFGGIIVGLIWNLISDNGHVKITSNS